MTLPAVSLCLSALREHCAGFAPTRECETGGVAIGAKKKSKEAREQVGALTANRERLLHYQNRERLLHYHNRERLLHYQHGKSAC